MKKGFTLTELLGVIVILAIVMGMAIVGVNYIIKVGKESVYLSNINILKASAGNYIIDNVDENMENLIKNGLKITLNDLENNGYLNKESFKAPDGATCDNSYVMVYKNTNFSKKKYNYNYQVCLTCTLNNVNVYESNECLKY